MAKVKLNGGPYWSKAWIQQLWEFTNQNFVDYDSGEVDFEALGREEYEFRKAMFFRNFKNSDRAKNAFEEAVKDYKKNVENGRKGGRPRNPDSPSPPQTRPNVKPISISRCPSTRDEFKEFVADNNLHIGLSEEWFAIHEGRGWVDESGEPIKNWKGAVTNYCNKKERRLNDAI